MTTPINRSRLGLCLLTMWTDVREGFVEITRHSLALAGLVVVLVSLVFLARPNLQTSASEVLFGWLQIRQNEAVELSAATPARGRLVTPSLDALTPDQAAVTRWLSRKYRVSMEPMGAMVAEAFSLGERSQMAPSLILAIMAIESRFNPFASSSQGNVGLMQLEMKAHEQAWGQFGGPLSAFDPMTNVRVGVRHLQGLMQQTNSLEEALALYGASSGQALDSQYVDRILNEQKLLDKITEDQKTAKLTGKTNSARL